VYKKTSLAEQVSAARQILRPVPYAFFLLITISVLALAGFTTLLHLLQHTVDGYEDEAGFHEGSESRSEGIRTRRSEDVMLGDF
jgi:hypothetical protein